MPPRSKREFVQIRGPRRLLGEKRRPGAVTRCSICSLRPPRAFPPPSPPHRRSASRTVRTSWPSQRRPSLVRTPRFKQPAGRQCYVMYSRCGCDHTGPSASNLILTEHALAAVTRQCARDFAVSVRSRVPHARPNDARCDVDPVSHTGPSRIAPGSVALVERGARPEHLRRCRRHCEPENLPPGSR